MISMKNGRLTLNKKVKIGYFPHAYVTPSDILYIVAGSEWDKTEICFHSGQVITIRGQCPDIAQQLGWIEPESDQTGVVVIKGDENVGKVEEAGQGKAR